MRAAADTDPRPPGGWSDERMGEDDVAPEVAGDGVRVDDGVEGARDVTDDDSPAQLVSRVSRRKVVE
jgi:hypothetical protein